MRRATRCKGCVLIEITRTMPRVVGDQKSKFETDELFKKLSQESDVKYTGCRDKPHEERKVKFREDLTNGTAFVSFVVTGTNLTLQLMPKALSGEKAENEEPPAESVDYHRDYGKVHMTSAFIFNGVCIKWVGWIDLHTLNGKAKLVFDAETAAEEDKLMREAMEQARERQRQFEESQRRWQEQMQLGATNNSATAEVQTQT
ncbi:core-binding factor subunit beta-like isoform X2 [Dysidea avara]|uniref:core-binding factor subunit beta-like isoform X2 n=1 Tax=Dysidea avara TaxID=196820 RepID=UPI00331D886C